MTTPHSAQTTAPGALLDGPAGPHIRLVKGSAEPEELAALVAVLLTAARRPGARRPHTVTHRPGWRHLPPQVPGARTPAGLGWQR